MRFSLSKIIILFLYLVLLILSVKFFIFVGWCVFVAMLYFGAF